VSRGLAALLVPLLAIVAPEVAAGAPADGPAISAPAAVVVDAADGHVLYARADRRHRPIASTTKLMTALLSLQEFPLSRRLAAVPYSAGPAESQIHLRPGERMSVRDLLRALLLESANDAAATLARRAAGSQREFVALMNERAQRLGLTDTHYENPIGLDAAGNYSSALDLATLARTLLRDRSFAATVNRPGARLRTGSRERIIANRNRLVASVPWIDGVKTGHTASAGYVLVGAGTRKGVQLVSVVLGAPTEAQRDADTLALLRYGFDRYRVARPVRRGAALASPQVEYYGDRRVALVPRRTVRVPLRSGQRVRTVVSAPDEIKGPLDEGARVGSVTVSKEGRRVARVPLFTAESVPEAGLFRKFLHSPLAVVVALSLLAALLVARRRSRVRRKSGRRPRRVVT
jgi:D-alanyl-D-alanine carboxypeptidase (penicillin-binding protein 5/6)